jgi:ribonuclease M5
MRTQVLLQALQQAGAQQEAPRTGRVITYADLYELGLSGTAGSAETRRAWLNTIGLPPRLSKKALCEALNRLYTYEEFLALAPSPVDAPDETTDI